MIEKDVKPQKKNQFQFKFGLKIDMFKKKKKTYLITCYYKSTSLFRINL